MSTNPPPLDDLRYFEVEVLFTDGRARRTLDTWRGLARDTQHAQDQAFEAVWDPRLTSGGSSPAFSTQQFERYLVSEGWGHIFVGNHESATRWVLDRATEKLVAADVYQALGSSWAPLSAEHVKDLLDSLIHANDILRDFQDFDVEASNGIPRWAKPVPEPVPKSTPVRRPKP